jgi:hypothetical protein
MWKQLPGKSGIADGSGGKTADRIKLKPLPFVFWGSIYLLQNEFRMIWKNFCKSFFCWIGNLHWAYGKSWKIVQKKLYIISIGNTCKNRFIAYLATIKSIIWKLESNVKNITYQFSVCIHIFVYTYYLCIDIIVYSYNV